MPPRESYLDRVFTTGPVSYPGAAHIGADKDFTPLIEKALALGGFPEDKTFPGVNGGASVTTGFGRQAVLAAAGQIVEAVKSGAIRRFYLVGGCDGARAGRNYFTEFVRQTPADSVVLTLACGKYRFNDLDLGTVAGLPRLLDIGQCNDAYSAIEIALALAEAFGCGVNDLPLSYGPLLVRAEGRLHFADAAPPGHPEHPPGPDAAGLPLAQRPLLPGGALHIAPTTTPEADLAALG